MSRQLEIQSLLADLSSVKEMLGRLPARDFAGRSGFESRRREIESTLSELQAEENDRLANVGLFFGGKPVIGSRGIKADFAGEVIANYQDLISKIWATGETGNLAAKGPVRSAAASQLHVTEVLHGSFGFVLEELDQLGTPLFHSPLRDATAKATQLLKAFASKEEEEFEQVIDLVPQQVFLALRDFLKPIHTDEAVFRILEGGTDACFDEASVERAYKRAEAYSIEEEMFEPEGELLGVIPIGRKFEFKQGDGVVLKGDVGALFSQAYLERIEKEHLVGKRWKAKVNRRLKKSFGKTNESLTLVDLQELGSASNSDDRITTP
jgi:hypothetical protein